LRGADAGGAPDPGCGRLRPGAVQALVWLDPGWSAARDLPGSSLATTTCGPVCMTNPLPPGGFGAAHQVFDAGPKRDGGEGQ
jgi:hypothetical protein